MVKKRLRELEQQRKADEANRERNGGGGGSVESDRTLITGKVRTVQCSNIEDTICKKWSIRKPAVSLPFKLSYYWFLQF